MAHSFSGGTSDGWDPGGTIVADRNGLYGITLYGGAVLYVWMRHDLRASTVTEVSVVSLRARVAQLRMGLEY